MPPPADLPPDISALLASERIAPPPPAVMQARVLSGVQQAILAGTGAGLGATATVGWWVGRGALFKGLAIAAVGTSLAAGGWTLASHARTPARIEPHAWVVRTVPRATPRTTVAPVVLARPVLVAPAAEPAAPPVVAATTTLTVRHEPSAQPSLAHDDALRRETDLITQAHAAIARRDGRAAIAALHTYARDVHGGQLGEDSEFVWIEALALEGDSAGARARAARFLRRYPGSPNAESVDRLVANLP